MDPLIKSQLLYQLSYAPCASFCAGRVLYQRDAVLSSKATKGLGVGQFESGAKARQPYDRPSGITRGGSPRYRCRCIRLLP